MEESLIDLQPALQHLKAIAITAGNDYTEQTSDKTDITIHVMGVEPEDIKLFPLLKGYLGKNLEIWEEDDLLEFTHIP